MPRRFDDATQAQFERVNRRIGARVKDARLEAGMTQSELATCLAGRQKSWISLIEQGRIGLNTLDFIRLSDVLDKPLHYFFSDGLLSAPQVVVPSRLEDWQAMWPRDPARAKAHFEVDRIFESGNRTVREREKALA